MAVNHPSDDDDSLLLRDAASGDAVALRKLLGPHRDRLRRMVALRLSSRLAAQVDPSDVVHEAFLEAETKLGDYLRDRPMPFYPWLHRLAAERLAAIRLRHMPTEAGDGPLEASDTFIASARNAPAHGRDPSRSGHQFRPGPSSRGAPSSDSDRP